MPLASPRSELSVDSPDDRGWTGVAWRWTWDEPVRMASTALYGGGIGDRRWIANLTVERDYADLDPAGHAAELAPRFGGATTGTILMTALDVRRSLGVRNEGVNVEGSVAIGAVCWAADSDRAGSVWRPGTVNVIVWVPEPLADSALLNVMTTVAEAKAQAFHDLAIPATSTPSDAIVVACPTGPVAERGWYGGPRSHWGSRVARVAHRLVLDGAGADGVSHGIDDDGSWRRL